MFIIFGSDVELTSTLQADLHPGPVLCFAALLPLVTYQGIFFFINPLSAVQHTFDISVVYMLYIHYRFALEAHRGQIIIFITYFVLITRNVILFQHKRIIQWRSKRMQVLFFEDRSTTTAQMIKKV